MKHVKLDIIGEVDSCFKQKFAIPRQPGLVKSSKARIKIFSDYAISEAFEGLEQSSHIWVQFVFHRAQSSQWKPKIRPPRLGGNRKIGVFASRSTHRPNSLGLSVVKLDGIDYSDGVCLDISGHDLLDSTPVLDIKPYIPYSDLIPKAENSLASKKPDELEVILTNEAQKQIEIISRNDFEDDDLMESIKDMLSYDARPAYQSLDSERVYGTIFYDFDLRWRYIETEQGSAVEVLSLDAVK